VTPIVSLLRCVVDGRFPDHSSSEYHCGSHSENPRGVAMAIENKSDWRSPLLHAATRDARDVRSAVRHAVQGALAAGADPSEVQRFVAEHKVADAVADIFGDDGAARRAAGQLLDQTQPRMLAPTSQSGRPASAQRPHQLRLDPHGALPWHQRASLPSLPVTFATGAAVDVVVQGQRFTPADVAALLV
jgi:hypothetical protein